MAPDPRTSEPANEDWLQLRRKHDANLQEFQRRFQEAHARLLQNVERERAEILDGHRREEEAFWSKPNSGKKPTAKNRSANSQGNITVAASTAKTGNGVNQAPGSNSRTTPSAKKTPTTPKSSRTTSQISPSTTAATTPGSRPASKKALVTYIDLCSDDDEPVVLKEAIQPPAVDTYQEKPRSIPKATLELFGKSVKTSNITPESAQSKSESSVFTQSPLVHVTSSTTQHRPENGTFSPYPPNSNFAQSGPNAAFHIQRSNFSDSNGFGNWTASNTVNLPSIRDHSGTETSAGNLSLGQTGKMPRALPLQHLHQPASGETNSSRRPFTYSPWATPTVSAFKGFKSYKPKSDGRSSPAGFAKPEPPPSLSTFASLNASSQVNKIPYQPQHKLVEQHAEQPVYDGLSPHDNTHQREPTLIPLFRKDVEMLNGYSPTIHDPHTLHTSSDPRPPSTPRPQHYVPNLIPPPSVITVSPRTPTKQTPFFQPSSPQSSLTPISDMSARITPSGSAFRKPSFQANASRDAAPAARNVRAGSQTSNSSLKASAARNSDRGTSVTSQTTISSSRPKVTRGRKRLIIDLSSDEEASDYSPPSDDNEIDSTKGDRKGNKGIKEGRKQGPGLATKKSRHCPPPLSAMTPSPVSSKGKNGFGFQVSPQLKAKTESQAPLSLSCKPPRRPGGRAQPTASSRVSKQTTKFTTTASIPRSPRKAKQSALDKIAELSERDTLLWTEETTAEASKQKQAESGILEEVRSGMRSMSITPVPSTAKDSKEEGDGLANKSDDTNAETPRRRTNSRFTVRLDSKRNEGWESWTHSRSQGDRHLAKQRVLISDDEHEDSEPDISEYTVQNGQAEAYEIRKDERWRSRSGRIRGSG